MDVRIEESWRLTLEHEFNAPYFADLKKFVQQEYKTNSIWPEAKNIYRAYNESPLNQVKVVILGQDPYPTAGHAHGLSFSVDSTVKPLPKSLQNIYKEIKSDLGRDSITSGDLSSWSKEGVFLLNSSLTVQEGEPNSHQKKGWEKFTDATIKAISENCKGVVFLLWGSKAQSKIELIDQSKHKILTAVHPSPLSAYRGFFGCKHFSKANAFLEAEGKEPINW